MKKEIKISKKHDDIKRENIYKLIRIICNAVGLAMGIGVIVLYVLKELSTNDAIIMLGIGIFCVSFPAIMKKTNR